MFENYPQFEYPLARIQLVLFMLGMGATLPVMDFAGIFRRPRSFFVGLGCQFLFVPLVAVAVNSLPGLHREGPPGNGIAIGLVLVALMPGGTVSKLFTHLGRGNVALSINLSVCTTMAAVVTVPLLLRPLALDAFEHVPEDFSVPVDHVILDVAVYMLVPLVMGMIWARLYPEWRRPFSRWCIRAGWAFVAVMVVGSLGSGRIRPGEYGWQTSLAIILFCLLAQQGSMIPFYLFHWPRPDRLAIGIEMTMRNMNLALLLKNVLFPARQGSDPIGDGVFFVILYYAAVALVAGLPLALNHRRLARKEESVVRGP